MLLFVERNAGVRRIFFRYKLFFFRENLFFFREKYFFFREKFMDTSIAFYGHWYSILLTAV
jgi:hypothetical protein